MATQHLCDLCGSATEPMRRVEFSVQRYAVDGSRNVLIDEPREWRRFDLCDEHIRLVREAIDEIRTQL